MLQRFILLKLIANKAYINTYFYIILTSYTVVAVVVVPNESVRTSALAAPIPYSSGNCNRTSVSGYGATRAPSSSGI